MILATKGQGWPIGWIPHVGRLFIVLGVCLSCASCFPLRFNASPGASGVVLNSQSRSPLAGAEVVVSKMIYPPPSADEAFTNNRPPVITTDAGGHFSIPADRRWDIFVVPIDLFPRFGLLVVKRDGYESAAIPFWSRSVTDVGEVVMKPVKNDGDGHSRTNAVRAKDR